MQQEQATGTGTTWKRAGWRLALQRSLTLLHLWLYRLTGGVIGHRLGPLPNVLLTTTGRRSGHPRTTILTYITEGGQLALIASNFGSQTPPQWYRNLEAQPVARVQLKRRRWSVRARPATEAERVRLWAAALKIWPRYAGYAERARRVIPIVVLDPVKDTGVS
ncbi:MAG TPA: nitroreductase family deazaflavin-dependent oxidoreductase [Ktedonobacterales bacterium]|nr:nitroreductase family deazaflavin-dependent oxidoreductase [Ktedonobacterales bacterium]